MIRILIRQVSGIEGDNDKYTQVPSIDRLLAITNRLDNMLAHLAHLENHSVL